MSTRIAWLLAALIAVCAAARAVVLAISDRLWTAETLTAGFPLVDLGAVVGGVIGALIVSRYPRHRLGWLFVAGQLFTELGVLAHAYGVAAVRGDLAGAPAGRLALWLGLQTGAFPTLALLALLFLLAPDGRMPTGRWRVGVWLSLVGLAVHAAALATFSADEVDDVGQVAGPQDAAQQLLLLCAYASISAGVIVGAWSLVRRLRHSDGRTREQLTWITLAAVVLAAAAVFTLGSVEWLRLPAWLALLPLMVAYAAVPALTGIGILRHQLFGVDVVLNRAIVFATLSGGATFLYVAVVLMAGEWAPVSGGDPGPWWPLIVTAVVAIALQPLRSRAARFADRLVYGAQAVPYVALADFTRDLRDVPHPRDMLGRVAEAIGRTVGAAEVRLEVLAPAHPDGRTLEATWTGGEPSGRRGEIRSTVPIVAGDGTRLGTVTLTMPPGRGLRALERQLLADFVAQIAHAVTNLRLGAELSARVEELADQTASLEASRRRLAAAQAEERIRFEDAIKHVVLPHLQPLPRALRRLAGAGPAELTEDAIVALMTRANQAVEALRTVTRGVFPAQLARRGLAPALATHLSHAGLEVSLDADTARYEERLDPRLESTLYFGVIDLLDGMESVHTVELKRPDASHVAVTVTGVASIRMQPRLRVLADRLAVFDGTVRPAPATSGSAFRLELPTPSPADALPGTAEGVRVE